MASIIRHKKGWRAVIRRAGRKTITKVCATKQEAQVWARGVETELDEGRHQPRGLRTTLADMTRHYLSYICDERASRTKRVTIENLHDAIGTLRVQEVTTPQLIAYARKRANAGAKPATILLDLTFLGTVLRYAGPAMGVQKESQSALLELATARDILRHSRLIGPSERRERRPTEDELYRLQAYWSSIDAPTIPMFDIVLFAISTAMRLGEIVRMRFDDIDTDKRMVTIRDRKDPVRKHGNHQRVPLLLFAHYRKELIDPLEIVTRQRERHSNACVFPYSQQRVSMAFRRGTERAGIDDLRFHDLRHHSVSLMFEYGFAIQEVALVSGHRTWDNLRRYTHLKPETLHNR